MATSTQEARCNACHSVMHSHGFRPQSADRTMFAHRSVAQSPLRGTGRRMAIEWNRIDIALFNALPRTDTNLIAAVEAKKRGRTCLKSSTQVFGYVSQRGRENCFRAVATEGLLYSVFRRGTKNSFGTTPKSYLNLTRMVSEYPLLGCAGAKEALLMMASDWSGSLDGREPISLAGDAQLAP